MICITIWVFVFSILQASEPKNATTIALLRTENAMWIPHPAQKQQPFRAFCISSRRDIPGETSLLSSVSTARGLLLYDETQPGIVFFEPKCRPLRCSSSGYRVAHDRVTAGLVIGLPLVGPDRVDPSLRFGRYGRTLGNLARISQIFAISRQFSRALAISKTTHCIRLSTADKGQAYG